MRKSIPCADFEFEPPEPAATTPRTRAVAAEFGVASSSSSASASTTTTTARRAPRRAMPPIALPSPGELFLLCGASGSGKSSLLRAMRRRAMRAGTRVIDLRRPPLARGTPTLDLFGDDEPVAATLRRLSRVGLAELWTWLRPASQLSEGQRWRLRVALALQRAERSDGPALIVCDEFAAVLDRVSAYVVASTLRRAVSGAPTRLSALVATSHDDLTLALAPDVRATCDFGRVTVARKEARDAT